MPHALQQPEAQVNSTQDDLNTDLLNNIQVTAANNQVQPVGLVG